MSRLFKPFDLAGLTLSNRVVMAPLTRSRAPDDVADERIALYYAQRATAGLIVSEGTPISREGQGYLFNPGIFTDAQIAGWRLTTNSVHAVGGHMFAQIWHVGRVSHPSIQEDGKLPVSPSSKQPVGAQAFGYDTDGEPNLVAPPAPRQLATEEIHRIVAEFAQAADNAIAAGFDGVEIHGANGYLHEQFLNPLVNDRDDEFSARTMENRLRFTLAVIDAVVARIGASRVGTRISPYGQLFDMPLHPEIDATYTALAQEIGKRKLAYVHLMDQSGFIVGETKIDSGAASGFQALLGKLKSYLPDTALILAGGMTRERAEQLIEDGLIDLAAFGASFISNPDLVARLENGWALTPADRSTFYGGGAEGYIDYAPYKAAA
ncbi:alkene reductase [Cupriavidus plantarum]|uniref:2,4-dienoyl-CoA reductase-like NADH-dependent reductase (Old Yellow Enzyme family) n=1 Tax=Cupriavidus plantarum TaxID=942865 RepID=A0A316F430_9BURK|nr:alkene reductase [Cupriavidus plantarum]PWK38992.1 2,4-dienoyl-CoA reductase-like NADH-dependent reductase (Old Yellow Enzyme family) [Cupriavidus plantarum]